MGAGNKWNNGGVRVTNNKLYSWFITSRNKDNKDIESFKQKRIAFLAYEEEDSSVINSISVPNRVLSRLKKATMTEPEGTVLRLYRSVNSLNSNEIKRQLIVTILTKEGKPITNIESIAVSVAMEPSNHCFNERRWLLDFDSENADILNTMISEISNVSGEIEIYKTPNGYAVITEHGFDTREFAIKYGDVITVKKNAMLFITQAKSNGIDIDKCVELV